MSSDISVPLAASARPGFTTSASENLPEPYLSRAMARPATVPGTPMASAELRDFAISGLPSLPRKISLFVAAGAVSR